MGERLAGRSVVVTGGASGLGRAIALRFADEGAYVVVGDLRAEPREGGEPIAELLGARGVFRTADAAVAGDIDGLVRTAIEHAGRLDVMVCNAGVAGRWSKGLLETTEEDWDAIMAVNLRGVIATTHAVLPAMHQRGGGVIVNVASEAGRVGSQGSVVYSAAKAGVIGFTRAIARESARYGIRSNAVAPGPIETPLLSSAPAMLGELGERLKQGMIAGTVMRRIGSPDEVAAAIAYLASDDASYVTGQTLNVSGGLSMS